jgi:hypothetical protein
MMLYVLYTFDTIDTLWRNQRHYFRAIAIEMSLC